jgi:flagellar basal body-associated protein FliL
LGNFENIFNIVGGIIGIYFIIAMLLFFRYLYFKKGSLKKALLHILLSVLLLCAVVGVYIGYGKVVSSQASDPGTFTESMKRLLDTTSPEEANFNDLSQIVVLANFPIEEADKVYLDKIKDYYIFYQMSISSNSKTREELSQQFDELRAGVDWTP